ncbi:rRNA maturation RNase YbeY [bacterium]|nr:rRNA maturation RNase YbeY [bacterium]
MSSDYEVNLSNRQSKYLVRKDWFDQAVCQVFSGEGYPRGEVNIAVVDNTEIHETNVRFLQHDYPTDVITFPMERSEDYLAGDIMLSAQYAAGEAQQYGWTVEEEMTLYVVHGCLHLAGYDDHEEEDRQEMRRLERHYLEQIGIRYAGTSSASDSPSHGAT